MSTAPQKPVFAALWNSLRQSRRIVLLCALCFCGISLVFACREVPRYTSTVTLIPNLDALAVDRRFASPQSAAAGPGAVDIDDGDVETATGEAVEYMRSRAFTHDFLQAHPEVLQTLVNFVGAQTGHPEVTARQPDRLYTAACDLFEQRVRHAFRDEDTGLLRISAEWVDADSAAAWANDMAAFLNAQFRAKNLASIASKISNSRMQLAQSGDQFTRLALAGTLSREATHYSLAAGTTNYLFRVVEAALAADIQRRTANVLALSGAAGLGLGLSVGALFGALRFCYEVVRSA